jgi:hypothetical protein
LQAQAIDVVQRPARFLRDGDSHITTQVRVGKRLPKNARYKDGAPQFPGDALLPVASAMALRRAC